MKVFFDIITNHTADVIDYQAGQYAYIYQGGRPYKDAAGRLQRPRLCGRRHLPGARPGDVLPVPADLPDRGRRDGQGAGLAERSDLYHNRGNATFDGEGSVYGDFVGLDDLFTEHPTVRDGMIDIYKYWAEFGIDGFRIDTVKHVNIEFWQKFAPECWTRAQGGGKPNSSCSARCTTPTRRIPGTPPRATCRRRSTSASRTTRPSSRRASRPRDARPLRQRRLLHRRGLERLLAADVPGQPRHGPHRQLPLRAAPSRRRTPAAGPAGALADVPEPRSAGRLLRRRAGLRRRRRRQGRAPGHVRHQGRPYNDDDLMRHRRDHRSGQLQYQPPAVPALADLRRCGPGPGARRRRADPPLRLDGPGIYAFSRIDADQQVEYLVARTTPPPPSPRVRHLHKNTRFQTVWPAGTAAPKSTARAGCRSRCRRSRCGRARRRRSSRSSHAAPAVLQLPGRGATVGGRAQIGVAVPADGFNQVTFAAARRRRRLDRRSARTTTRRTACSTTSAASRRARSWSTAPCEGPLRQLLGRQRVGTVGTIRRRRQRRGWRRGRRAAGLRAVPGDLNTRWAARGDWHPACDQAQLTLDPGTRSGRDVHVPAGRATRTRSPSTRLGTRTTARAVPDGGNITLTAPGGAGHVLLRPPHALGHSDAQGPIVTAAGMFQSELGCAADWSAGLHAVVAEGPGRRRHLHLCHQRYPGRQLRGEGRARPVAGTRTTAPAVPAARTSPSPCPGR